MANGYQATMLKKLKGKMKRRNTEPLGLLPLSLTAGGSSPLEGKSSGLLSDTSPADQDDQIPARVSLASTPQDLSLHDNDAQDDTDF